MTLNDLQAFKTLINGHNEDLDVLDQDLQESQTDKPETSKDNNDTW